MLVAWPKYNPPLGLTYTQSHGRRADNCPNSPICVEFCDDYIHVANQKRKSNIDLPPILDIVVSTLDQ